MVTECPEAWSFENPEIVIPAGEITATTTVNGDWSFANEIEEAKTWNSQVVVSAVAPTSIARVSSTLGSLNVTVNKLAIVYENVEMKTPSGTQFDDASSWVVYVDGEKNSKLTDGDLKNYAYELNQMEVVIDFGDERTLTGFCTKNGFGESYAPEKFTVSTSNDNTNWIVQQENIELPTDVVDYDFAFKESVTCRYLKLYITGARCLVSEIFVYGE